VTHKHPTRLNIKEKEYFFVNKPIITIFAVELKTGKGTSSPLLSFLNVKYAKMIDKQLVKAIVEEGLAESESFLVDVVVRPGNAIVVEIDNEEGVDIAECITLTRLIESKIDREVEDYELEVGSAGVTQPFKVLRQYQKNIGNEVEVLSKDGRKLTGVLKDANEDFFTVTTLVKVKIEGEKRKKEVESDLNFKYEEIKHCKYLIRFK